MIYGVEHSKLGLTFAPDGLRALSLRVHRHLKRLAGADAEGIAGNGGMAVTGGKALGGAGIGDQLATPYELTDELGIARHS